MWYCIDVTGIRERMKCFTDFFMNLVFILTKAVIGEMMKSMRFGLRKMTLLDFPGKVACTVFTCGCNFRCPFCHNASLVRGSETDMELSAGELLEFLDRRKGLLDGVAVTGGEPLLHTGSAELLKECKARNYAVKLDTNGSFPERLAEILDSGVVDYVAMDIKSSLERYDIVCGREGMKDKVMQSMELLMKGSVAYEFRTTVVNELHEVSDIEAVAQMIAGAQRYFLQNFVETGDLLSPGASFTGVGKEKLQAMLEAARKYVPAAEIRGTAM